MIWLLLFVLALSLVTIYAIYNDARRVYGRATRRAQLSDFEVVINDMRQGFVAVGQAARQVQVSFDSFAARFGRDGNR